MLNTFVACARNSSVRDSCSGITFVKAISNTLVPGPIMLLRRAVPYWQVEGLANAAVLNHSPIDGCDSCTASPATTSARRAHRSGSGEAVLGVPKRQLPQIIRRKFLCLIKARKAALR